MLAEQKDLMPRKTKTPEGFVSGAVRDLLAAERIFCLRVNSGSILTVGANEKKYRVKLADKGTADLLAFVPAYDGFFLPTWIETKAGKNGLSPEQESFRDDVVGRGMAYIVARGSDDVLGWLIEFREAIRTSMEAV